MRSSAFTVPFLVLLALLGTAAAAFAQDESSPYGINIHAPEGQDLTVQLGKVEEAGIGWVRIDFIWALVQPSPGVWDWRLYDRLTEEAQARGLAIFASIAYTPEWASAGPELSGVPDDPDDWREFCTRAARRYRDSIRHWGVWNEPNLPRFWAGSRRQYIDLILKPGIAALKAGNAEAQVGGPDLAHLTSGSSDWYDWLHEVLEEAGGQLDFVTHHVYDSDGHRDVTKKLEERTPFGNRPSFWDIITPSVKEVLAVAGAATKPFWLTETGWRSDGAFEASQATFLRGLLDDWLTGRPGRDWVNKVFFYELSDSAGAPDLTWGILRANRSPKPSFFAYRDFIAAHTPVRHDSRLVQETFPSVMESGQPLTVRVTLRNTGTSTWTRQAGFALAATGDRDPLGAAARQHLEPGESIAPGQEKTFSLALTAPAIPDRYRTSWRMVKEGLARFGDTVQKDIEVSAAPPLSERALDLLGARFRVEVSWRDHAGRAGFGRARSGAGQTGTFWFFDPANTELVVKALDGRAVNDRYWFFYGALSDVEYQVKVTDRVTGAVRTYQNPSGNLCGRGDTAAFVPGSQAAMVPVELLPEVRPTAAPPFAAAVACAPGPRTLCLEGGRFKVEAEWRTRDGVRGFATAVPDSDQTGTFWFFDPQNVELVVKLLDGRPVNDRFWFFYGALSDVEYWITVTDTTTGVFKQYYNAPGNLCGQGDTAAL